MPDIPNLPRRLLGDTVAVAVGLTEDDTEDLHSVKELSLMLVTELARRTAAGATTPVIVAYLRASDGGRQMLDKLLEITAGAQRVEFLGSAPEFDEGQRAWIDSHPRGWVVAAWCTYSTQKSKARLS